MEIATVLFLMLMFATFGALQELEARHDRRQVRKMVQEHDEFLNKQ